MDETSQHVITATAAVGKWGGFTAAGWGAFTVNEQLAIAGFAVGVIGTIVNSFMTWHYKRKDDKRSEIELKMAAEAHAARMAGLLE